MKLTNAQIAQAAPALRALTSGTGIRGRAAFKLSRIVVSVEPILKAFGEARQGLVEQHAEQNGKGPKVDKAGNIVFKDPAAFVADMQPLLDAETEINVQPLTVDELADAIPGQAEENGKPVQMWEAFTLLGPLVTDPEAEAGA